MSLWERVYRGIERREKALQGSQEGAAGRL